MSLLSHTDEKGKANMVDIGLKPEQLRTARARGEIKMSSLASLLRDNKMKKGDVLTVAEIAGIQAAKRTPELIPLCHQLLLNRVSVMAHLTDEAVIVQSEAVCTGKTGVEMEALTAVSVALLTIYDMCKAVDRLMLIGNIELVEKTKEDVK